MQFVCFLPVGFLKLDIIIKLPIHVLIWQTYMAGDRVVLEAFQHGQVQSAPCGVLKFWGM